MYTVLYVDDEQALLELGKTFLELSGSITVVTAISAIEGIEALNKNAFDCIISDYQMPVMDGLAFLKFLRKGNNNIPFILFTGRGREEVVIDAVNNGVDYYLQKGGDPKAQFVELEHKIKLAIERRRTDDELMESRQRMTDIIDHLPDATLAIDLDGKVIAWNRAMEEMTGIDKEQILGTGDHSYALPFYGTRRPILLDLVLNADEETWKKYPQIIRKDSKLISEIHIPILYGGKGAYLWFIASPLYDTHGNITGAIESIRDITVRKMTENELRAAYEQITASEEELREQYDELKKGEDALRESEENYRALFDEAADIIVILDANGTFLNLNRTFIDETGYLREEMLGKNVLTSGIVTASSAAKIAFHMGLVLLGKQPPIFEIDGKVKNGTIIPYEIRATPIKKLGNVIAVQATLRNLTERKNAEKEISDRKKMLEEIVSGSPIPQFVIDKNHRVVSWNRALEEASGVNAKEVLGTTNSWKAFYDKERPVLADLLVGNDPEKIQEWYAGKFDKSKYIDGAYEATDFFPQMGGSGIWLYFTAAVLRDSEGTIVGAVETLEDITERKKAEDELRASYEQITASEEGLRDQLDQLQKSEVLLRESERKFRAIFDQTFQFIGLMTTDGTLIEANRTALKFSGIKESEILGKPFWETPWWIHSEKLQEKLRRSVKDAAKGEFVRFEATHLAADGHFHYIDFSIKPVMDEAGNVVLLIPEGRDITDRKKMENSIRANEEKYRSLVDNLNVGVYRNTAEFPGRTIWANPAFVRIFGYDSLQECLEHPVMDNYANPEERKKFIQVLKTDGVVKDYELQLKKKDGTQIWVSITAQAKKNTEGTIEWIDGICDDITALKDAEENCRCYQLEMSRAIDYLPDATFIIDRKGRVLAWNRAIEEMTGVNAKDIIGRGDYEYAIPFYGYRRPILIDLIFAPEDEIKKGDYVEIKRTGEILSVETPNPILKGKPAVVRAIAAPIYDEAGNVAGAIETITDITELKRAQEDLMASENRYRTIFENTGTATVLLEENTIISIANVEFERMSGYPREELEGKKSWTEFVVKEDLERMLAQHRMRREKHEEALRHYEFRFITKTGEIRNIFLTIDVIPGTKQSVASLMDITAQVRAQDTVNLANKKLNLLSSITRHDIKNQLLALSGFLELSKESFNDPTRISEFTDKEMHITDTISSLINFTRDYEGLGVNAPVWQNVHTVIGNIATRLPSRDIRLDTGDPVLEVFADPLLERVFYNLIDNALRYGGEKMTSIRVSSHESSNGLVIIFEDDGAGIAIQDKTHLFEKGFGKNTGLGLFLSREILGITGITITVNGEPGTGARFEITVPEGAFRFTGTP
jgi:PAS domain S-box-containing protein